MKRFLVFIFIFGAGLGLLLYLQGQQSPKRQTQDTFRVDLQIDSELVPIPEGFDASEASSRPANGDQPSNTGRVGLKGRFKGLGYPKEGGDAVFVLTAEDASTATEGWLDLTSPVLTYPGIGTLVAKSGRIVFEDGGRSLAQGKLGGKVELQDGTLTLDEGHPLAPATFTAPSIAGDLDQLVFDLTEGPQLQNEYLQVSGDKIRLELNDNQVSVKGNGKAKVLAGEAVAERTLTGDLLVFKELSPKEIRLKAEGQAHLFLAPSSGQPLAVNLHAPNIGIDALRKTQKGLADQLALAGVQVSGGRGELTFGDATLSGEVFDFELGQAGEANKVVVRGAPHASFPAELAPNVDLETLAIEPNERIELESAEEISLTLNNDAEIVTQGQSALSFLGLSLQAKAGFEGYRKVATKKLHLVGRGGVSLSGELPSNPKDAPFRVNYRSNKLTIDHETLAGGSSTSLSSKGNTQLDVLQGDDDSAEFQSIKTLNFKLLEVNGVTTWSVPVAEMLSFKIKAGGMHTEGTATRIEDFQPALLQFEGRGMTLERKPLDETDPLASRSMSASGTKVIANGEQDLTIEGSELAPAYFSSGDLAISGTHLRRLKSTFTATGSVRANFVFGENQTAFNCDDLLVEGLVAERGQQTTATRLLARGSVLAESFIASQSLSLSAEEVELLNFGEDKLELHAQDGVDLTLTEADAEWRVVAGELDAFSSGSESSPPQDGSDWLKVVAQKEVVVTESNSGFSGRGDMFALNRGTVSKVLLEGKKEPAWVSCDLPGGGVYFGQTMRLSFDGETLVAEQVSGTIQGIFLPGTSKAAGASDLKLVCDLLTASVERFAEEVHDVLQLDGDVSISRKQTKEDRESLRAQHVTFDHLRTSKSNDPSTFEQLQTSFLAHGQVALHRGFEFHAIGNHLKVEAGSRELLFEGTPAAVVHAGFISMSTWILLDPLTMLVESGEGVICQDPAIIRRLFNGEQDK